MKLKQLGILILIVTTSFLVGIGNVKAAYTYNGSAEDDKPVGKVSAIKCTKQAKKYNLCTAGGQFLVVRMTVQYYNAKTNKMQPLEELGIKSAHPYYVYNDYGNTWRFLQRNCTLISGEGNNAKYENCERRTSWFGNATFNSSKMVSDTTIKKNGTDTNITYWLSKMGTSINQIQNLGLSNCEVDYSNNKTKCKNQSGFRIILEPIVMYHAPNNSRFDFLSYKDLAIKISKENATMLDKWGSYSSDNKSTNWSHGGLFTDFDDVGVLQGKNKDYDTYECLSNRQKPKWGWGCGYGYNIIDPGWTINEKKCVYNSNTKKCDITSGGKVVNGNLDCNATAGCPKIEYGCEEKKDKYGRCYIYTYVGGTKQANPEEVDCNDGNQGKITYKGNTLTKGNCPYKPKYNYDVDVACENCDDNNTNGSYEIQDVADWEAILHSPFRTDKPELAAYYAKGKNVYCRDEFNIVFPNANTVNNIYVEKGRYLTVNENGSIYNSGIYNFKTIKITRTRECIFENEQSANEYNIGTLKMGTVDLKYTEKSGEGKYNDTYTLNPKIKNTPNSKVETKQITSRTGAISGGTYYVKTQSTEAYYKLDDDLYRFVSPTGTSQKNKPTDENKYIDTKTSNLPISFQNEEGVTINLSYKLPDDTGLYKVVGGKTVQYFGSDSTVDNVYTSEQLEKNSACAKLYPDLNSDKYKNCKEKRQNKNDVKAANTCLAQFGDITNKSYSCDIKTCSGNNCPSDNKCKKPTSEDPNYRDDTGNIITEEKWKENCTCQEAKDGYLDKNGNLITDYNEYDKQCCVFDNDVDKEAAAKECPNNASMGLSACYRCPSGQCPMPGGVCPGTGEVIYRTIDLLNPFPGQSGTTRETGSNWCTYDLSNLKLKCAGKPTKDNQTVNQLVYNQIVNNRGFSGYEVYNQTPLYEITLDANAIKEITNYNTKNSYDDWSNITYSDAVGSHSKFLNQAWGNQKVTGNCMKSDNRYCEEGGVK